MTQDFESATFGQAATPAGPSPGRGGRIALALATIAVGGTLLSGGCNILGAMGSMAQNAEYQKLVEVPPVYERLSNKTVAVVVDADLTTRYEHPLVVNDISRGVAARIATKVPGTKVVQPRDVLQWQYKTQQWSSLPYADMAEQLNVDRVIYVDLYEYRLNPPGNRYEWEGVAAANVHIIERDGIDPDSAAGTFDVKAKYPERTGTGPESANQTLIATVLLNEFMNKTAGLFYLHTEPKYPDKYRPELQ